MGLRSQNRQRTTERADEHMYWILVIVQPTLINIAGKVDEWRSIEKQNAEAMRNYDKGVIVKNQGIKSGLKYIIYIYIYIYSTELASQLQIKNERIKEEKEERMVLQAELRSQEYEAQKMAVLNKEAEASNKRYLAMMYKETEAEAREVKRNQVS